jgi:NADPH-dependent dioxygenase
MSLYEGSVPRAQLQLSNLPGRYPFAVVLEQSVLEDLLEQQLRRAGSKVEWNHRLLEIKPSNTGVEACVEKLASSPRNVGKPDLEAGLEDRLTIHADFVVGADGHNSSLRRELNIRSVRVGAPQLFGVCEIEKADPMDHAMRLVLNKSANGILWPLAQNRCRWTFQLAPSKVGGEFPRKERDRLISERTRRELDGIDDLHNFLAERAPWFPLESILETNWVAVVQFQPQLALSFGQGRCWLAGDAAHQTSPAGMQSMNIGLLEGAELADKFKSILRDNAGVEVLQTYDRIRRAEWTGLLGLRGSQQPNSLLSWASRQFSTILATKEHAKWCRSFPSWARRHFGTILSSMPASGEDLNHLLKQLAPNTR